MKVLKKIGDVIKESNSKSNLKALPNSVKYSNSTRQMIGSLMNSKNSSKITQDEFNRATILVVPIQKSEDDTIKLNENTYELTPEIFKALTYPTYTGRTMKNESDILTMYAVLRDLGYTGIEDRKSNRKIFLTITLPKLVEEIQNKAFEEITLVSDSDLQGEGVKIIIPSNIIDIYSRLEILFGLKLSGHSNTLSEASNLIDELYKQGEIQNEQQYRNALNKFSSPQMELPSKILEQIAFSTRPNIEEHMLVIMDKFSLEEHLFQPLQTNKKQFKLAIT